jgi:oxaloacetate decarboxylase (Na+ extruding) subunit alpha
VRAEFGYPIMVTPLSQFVGSQAAINVIVGERYKEVTDQTIEYALGVWGKEGGAMMDPAVKDKILSRRRAKEIARREPPQMPLQELRRKFGGSSVSDEEILLRFFTSKEDVQRMRAAGPPRVYSNGNNALIRLVEELTKPTNRTNVFIQRGPLTVRLDKKQARA